MEPTRHRPAAAPPFDPRSGFDATWRRVSTLAEWLLASVPANRRLEGGSVRPDSTVSRPTICGSLIAPGLASGVIVGQQRVLNRPIPPDDFNRASGAPSFGRKAR